MSLIYKSEEEIIAKLLEEYRGLHKEDLAKMNPSYSCCICSKKDCTYRSTPRGACPEHVRMSIEEFALTYDFTKK